MVSSAIGSTFSVSYLQDRPEFLRLSNGELVHSFVTNAYTTTTSFFYGSTVLASGDYELNSLYAGVSQTLNGVAGFAAVTESNFGLAQVASDVKNFSSGVVTHISISADFGSNFYIETVGTVNGVGINYAADGGFTVSFVETINNEDFLRAVHYDVFGQSVTGIFDVKSSTDATFGNLNTATMANDKIALVWTEFAPIDSSTVIKLQMLNSEGTLIGAETTVAMPGLNSTATPELTVLNNGNLLIGWNDISSGEFKGRLYNSNGNAQGAEFNLARGSDIGEASFGTVGSLFDGGFVVAYYVENFGQHILKYRLYDADGSPRGPAQATPVLFNSAGDGEEVAVAGLANGGIALSVGRFWYVFNQGTNSDDVELMTEGGVYNALGGHDLVFGSSDDDVIDGGGGIDKIWGNDGDDTIRLGDDPSLGFNSQQEAYGGAGNDDIRGSGNLTIMDGGDGDDVIVAEYGNATLRGGAGNDAIQAGNGIDQIDGGNGNDTVKAGAGDDTVSGGAGNDVLRGNGGEDFLTGDGGRDILKGGEDRDDLLGGASKDRLYGGRDNDDLDGGSGKDTLFGGAGDDFLKGGSGEDVFVFRGDGLTRELVPNEYVGNNQVDEDGYWVDRTAEEEDFVADFTQGEDLIRIREATGVNSFGDLQIDYEGGAAVITYADREITVQGVAGAMTAGDFDIG